MVEAQVPIVDRVIANFLTNVANLDPRQWFVVLHTPDRDKERLNTKVVLTSDASCIDNGVVRNNSEGSRPELSRLYGGCVDHKLIRCHV